MSLDLLEMYTSLTEALAEIDVKIDSLDGDSSSLRSQVIKEKIEATKENWTQVCNSIVEQLAETPTEVQIGFYYGLARALDKTYGPTAKKFVEEKAATLPKPTPLISEEELPTIMEQRKEVYARIKSVMSMAETFDDDSFPLMEAPRRRGGAPKGKRGPRAISFFTWEIEGTEFAKLSEVIEVLPFYDRVKDLTAAMKAAKINTTKPPAEISFELPDGRLLIGNSTNVSSEVEGEEDPDPDSDDENSE